MQASPPKKTDTLTREGYKYMVVSRSKIKGYQAVQQGKEAYLLTKSKKIIRLTPIQNEKYTDHFLKVESPAKARKDQGIKSRLEQGYEEQLELIKQSLYKPGGIKKADKVQQRIGRANKNTRQYISFIPSM